MLSQFISNHPNNEDGLCVCVCVRNRFLRDGWTDLDETLHAYSTLMGEEYRPKKFFRFLKKKLRKILAVKKISPKKIADFFRAKKRSKGADQRVSLNKDFEWNACGECGA